MNADSSPWTAAAVDRALAQPAATDPPEYAELRRAFAGRLVNRTTEAPADRGTTHTPQHSSPEGGTR